MNVYFFFQVFCVLLFIDFAFVILFNRRRIF